MKSRCFCSGGIGQSCQHSVTAYVGMTDDSAGGSDSGEENDQEGDAQAHTRMHAHTHASTHTQPPSSSKASSHLFDTVITAHADSNDG